MGLPKPTTFEQQPVWSWTPPMDSGPTSSQHAADTLEQAPQVSPRINMAVTACLSAIPALLTLAVSFGLPWTPEQQASVVGGVAAITWAVVGVVTAVRKRRQ